MPYFGADEFNECKKARELYLNLEEIKKQYLSATKADGKLYFYCRGCAMLDPSNLIAPYEELDYRKCKEHNCKGCGVEGTCFEAMQNDWNAFVDKEGQGIFTHKSSIGEISAALLKSERLESRKQNVACEIFEIKTSLEKKDEPSRDVYLICKALSVLKKNRDVAEDIKDEFHKYILEKYGIGEDASADIIYDKVKERYK